MTNPTGAENAQVQDDADRRAREIVNTAQNLLAEIGNPPNVNDAGFCGCGECPQCLLDCARQSVEELIAALLGAEQRGMMLAAEIARKYGDQHSIVGQVAAAIERAAKED